MTIPKGFVPEESISEEFIPEEFVPEDSNDSSSLSKIKKYFSGDDAEGFAKNLQRTLMQVPVGGLSFLPLNIGLGALQLAGVGESLAEMQEFEDGREQELRNKFPQAPWKDSPAFDKDKYLNAIEDAASLVPTVENISNFIEEKTGTPLRPKTQFQKDLHFVSGVSSISPGSLQQKIFTGMKANAYANAMQETGVPEELSKIMGMVFSHYKFPSIVGRTSGEPPSGSRQPPSGSGEPPSGSGEPPSGSGSKKILAIPEHEIIEQIVPILEKSFDEQIASIGEKPKISSSNLRLDLPRPKIDVFEIENSIGNIFSRSRIPNSALAAKSIRDKINEMSLAEYRLVNKSYDLSKELNKNVTDFRLNMRDNLKQLVSEMSQAAEPSSIEKDIIKISNKYIKLAGNERDGFNKISNQSLISQIQSINKKIDTEYVHGNSKNIYLRLKNILSDAVEKTSYINKEAVDVYNKSKNLYAKWSSKFQSNEILPWRDPSNRSFTKLLKSIENPDHMYVLRQILDQDKYGINLYNMVLRDFIEKKFRPYINNLEKIDSLEYRDLMRDISPIVSADRRTDIDYALHSAREPILEYERMLKNRELYKKRHNDLVKTQKKALNDWLEKRKELDKNFPYKNESSILRDMGSVRGLRRLQKHLSNTKEGKEAFENVKDYIASTLLTNGKIDPKASPESLRKILNDVDKHALLVETLGKERTENLKKIVNNLENIEKTFSNKIKSGIKFAKIAGRFVPHVRNYIAAAESLYDSWELFKNAANKADYSSVDLDVINSILQESESIINK